LKLFGCVGSSLNEAIAYMSLKTLNRTIKRLTRKGTLAEQINAYDSNGRTPLINAIMSKRPDDAEPNNPAWNALDLIEKVLEAGADANFPDQYLGMTPLLYACSGKDEALVIMLLGKGADMNMCDFACVTPVMAAAGFNMFSTLSVMLNRLANVDAVDENGWLALLCAFLILFSSSFVFQFCFI
jgi:ankyrin repeat protein